MKERPILFSAAMVQSILAGNKTQTRRSIKPQPKLIKLIDSSFSFAVRKSEGIYNGLGMKEMLEICPYGQIGDQLWVRETHAIVPRTAYAQSEGVDQVYRPNDNHDAAIFRAGWERSKGGISWKPSIHMPRWASRIQLEITNILVERLQDISDPHARAEGVEGHYIEDGWYWRDYMLNDDDATVSPMLLSAKESFRSLWQSINGPDSWTANPWVWVIEFKRVERF